MLLNVVTAVSRLDYLFAVRRTLDPLKRHHEVRWYALGHVRAIGAYYTEITPVTDCSGAIQKNRALQVIDSGAVWFLDDDNGAHKDFAIALKEWSAPGVVYSQLNADGTTRLRADRNAAGIGEIDTAQFVLDRAAIGDTRFPLDSYQSDGHFFAEVFGRNPEIRFVDRAVTYHNRFRKQP